MERNLLIVSSTHASDEYMPVAEKLTRLGHEVAIYNVDQVRTGKDNLVVAVDKWGDKTITYNGKEISDGSVEALWYRDAPHPSTTRLSDIDIQLLQLQNSSTPSAHETLWTLYEHRKWLNAPENVQKSSQTLAQMLVAKEVGFSTPDTAATAQWADTQNRLIHDEQYQGIVAKMIQNMPSDDKQANIPSKNALTTEEMYTLRKYAVSLPGMFQPSMQKAREWYVAAVGEDVFPVAIYTEGAGNESWKDRQYKGAVGFRCRPIREEVAAQCVAFLEAFDLRFGTFDLVETQDGEIIFQACEANGHYRWFEENLNIPISGAIAHELIKIADSPFEEL